MSANDESGGDGESGHAGSVAFAQHGQQATTNQHHDRKRVDANGDPGGGGVVGDVGFGVFIQQSMETSSKSSFGGERANRLHALNRLAEMGDDEGSGIIENPA